MAKESRRARLIERQFIDLQSALAIDILLQHRPRMANLLA